MDEEEWCFMDSFRLLSNDDDKYKTLSFVTLDCDDKM